MHESQNEDQKTLIDPVNFNEDLLPLQRIEGGGSPKKADLSSMPKPVRMIGYFIFAFIVVMVFLLIATSLLK
jgi:hypothetical protein